MRRYACYLLACGLALAVVVGCRSPRGGCSGGSCPSASRGPYSGPAASPGYVSSPVSPALPPLSGGVRFPEGPGARPAPSFPSEGSGSR